MNEPSIPSIYECVSPTCKFRFPVVNSTELKSAAVCPLCGFPTLLVEISVQPQLRPAPKSHTRSQIHIEVLVDNLRSANNIGTIFRTSDAVGIDQIYLCGVSPVPPHPAITKTSLGAEDHVLWSHCRNAIDLLLEKRKAGYLILALEGGADSVPLFNIDHPPIQMPIILVIGNEIAGVDPGILRLCDRRLWIPMVGIKESLNVSIAYAIAVYTIKYRLKLAIA